MKPRKEIRDSQKRVAKFAQTLGYISDEQGVCQGIAIKGIEAFLIDEFELYEKRRQMILTLWKKSKGDVRTINYIIQAAETIRSTARKLGQAITKCVSIISKSVQYDFDVEDVLSIQPFFENIELYQQPELYQHLFDSTFQDAPTQRRVEIISLLAMSQTLQNKGGLVSKPAWQWLGIFTEERMFSYCRLLDKMVNDFDQNIACSIGSRNHACALFYDKETKTWIFLDPETTPARRYSAAQIADLAKDIMHTLRTNPEGPTVACDTKIFCTGETQEETAFFVDFLKQSREYEDLFEITQANANDKTADNMSFILLAASFDCTTQLKKLIACGVDINQQDDVGITPLIKATSWGNIESVKILIAAKADLNLASKSGSTAVHFAIKNEQNQILKMLLKAGANPALPDKQGMTPAMHAAKNGNLEALKLLAMHGVNLLAVSTISAISVLDHAKLEKEKLLREQSSSSPKLTRDTEKIKKLTAVIDYLTELQKTSLLTMSRQISDHVSKLKSVAATLPIPTSTYPRTRFVLNSCLVAARHQEKLAINKTALKKPVKNGKKALNRYALPPAIQDASSRVEAKNDSPIEVNSDVKKVE